MASDIGALQGSINASERPLALADLLVRHPELPRRTAQRWLSQLRSDGSIRAVGEGRGRRYLRCGPDAPVAAKEVFPTAIPVSEDSQDILSYLGQPADARKPVGYQRELLAAYRPNDTHYLPEPLRRRLRMLGQPAAADSEPAPAGTFGRAILNRLLIDLSWASSHMEGNTYTWLDTRELIERGDAAEGKAAIETQMILNHKAAIEMLIDNADIADFNRYTVLNLHSALAENLLPNLPLLRANLCPLTFLDVPEPAYTRAVLGVYELTRTELLRDLYVWAYERCAQEYLAIKQNLGDPDPTRLAYRELIRDTVHGVVTELPPDTLA